jgi:arylsulfatase A-like enzyme
VKSKYIIPKALASALVALSSLASMAARQPNIVIFYLDDMAWAQPGAYGGKLAPTPHMDALAKGGVRFTNGYSSACICSPARVGLLTGRYQARTGHDAQPGKPGREMLLSETTIAQYLKRAGYTTGIVGKWHVGDTTDEFMPASRGFDFAMGSLGNTNEGVLKYYRGNEKMADIEGGPITSPIYAKEACGFVEANEERPFFLYLSFNAVHTPLVASPKWLDQFKNLPEFKRNYASLLAEADEAIGTVMASLRELELEENTLVFCISDNGGAAACAEQLGLRGSKWFVWEGGIRVSWIAQWKGVIPANRVSSDPVIQLDVLPTALAAAGADKPEAAIDGVNLLPLLKAETDKLAPRELYFRFGVQHAVRKGDWKLVKATKDMTPMLVNLATDPGETTDLSDAEPAKKAELTALFEKWNTTMQPPRWEDQRWNGDPIGPKGPSSGKKKKLDSK